MSENDSVYRATVHFSGEVQGVNFRQRTLHIAEDFEVSGFVQNLLDGRVLLIAEGEQQEVKKFLASVQDKMEPLIADTEKSEETASSIQYDGFSIRW